MTANIIDFPRTVERRIKEKDPVRKAQMDIPSHEEVKAMLFIVRMGLCELATFSHHRLDAVKEARQDLRTARQMIDIILKDIGE